MGIKRWKPRIEPTKAEQRILKRLTRVRKLFAFLRLHRHEIVDAAFQDELAEMHFVFVVDERGHLVGRVPLFRLLLTPPEAPIREVMEAAIAEHGLEIAGAVLIVVFNLIADVLYAVADPRVSYD